MKHIRILLADDHPIFREGLMRILEKDPSFKVIAAAGNGDEAITQIRQKKPDVAVLDISMPGPSGIEIAARIREEELPTLPVILTMYSEQEYLANALEQGVCGYLLKEFTVLEIIDCIHAVTTGGYYISRQMRDCILKTRTSARDTDNLDDLLVKLTPAERQILYLLACNKTSAQIAQELFISCRTVQNHRFNIAQKLNLHGHNQLLFFALQHREHLLAEA